MIEFISLLLLLLFGHALADYPLQGDFLARGKNPAAPLPGAPWPYLMAAHATIHAGLVAILTGWVTLAVLEFIAHWAIDYAKCRGQLTFAQDQWLHVACKVLWALIVVLA